MQNVIKRVRNIKLIILTIILILCALYAIKAYTDIMVNNEYSRSIAAKALKLQKNKVYLFSTTLTILANADTIIIPIENKNFPDSLCYLFYENGEWIVKLSNNIRNNNKETSSNPLFPWCCTQAHDPSFFSKGSTINEHHLLNTGIKFNYYSGTPADRLAIKLYKEDDNYFLSSNLQFLDNTYPISKTGNNLIEVNFCNYADTIDNKFVFSFPFLGKGSKPERFLLNINKDSIFLSNSNAKINIKQSSFVINNIKFRLKENYNGIIQFMLFSVYIFILIVSLYNLYRLFLFYNKLPHRNLIIKEQTNIVTLRLLFNCIILLSYPLLIIQTKSTPDRLYIYSALVLCLNINWVGLFSYVKTKYNFANINSYLRKISQKTVATLIFLLITITVILIILFGNYECLFGIPVLHITKVLYVLLPFTLNSGLVKWIGRNRAVKKLNINIAYLLIIGLSAIIVIVSKDFATPIFTLLALFFITILQKENLSFIWDNAKRNWKSVSFFAVIVFIIFYLNRENIFSWYHSKVYRFSSTLFMPDSDFFKSVSEQSKQAVAQQVYLLKASFTDFNIVPNFNEAILPTFKTTFFSDYSVLWSFKIGNYPFLIIYFSILVYLSYCIITLLIILNKKIPLHNGKMVSYNSKMVLIFNVLLSLFLVQYIYTFLSNLWLLPLTGQSPGILCPSIFELIFHTAFINALYFFIDKRSIIEDMPTKLPTVYTKIRKKAIIPIIILFMASLGLVGLQSSRIIRLDDEMKLSIPKINVTERLSQDSLEYYARIAFKDDDISKFRMLHNQFYDNNNLGVNSYQLTLSFINFNTNSDSLLSNRKRIIPTRDHDFFTYNKTINAVQFNHNNAINNVFYSGFPIKSNTINYSLQKELNISLKNWAERINSSINYQMVSGCVIVAKNNGEIASSASYPFLFNENKYHIQYIEDSIRKIVDFRFKYHTVNEYINFAEYDAMPGSIVKPLLAYCALKLLPKNNSALSAKSLNFFIGKSDPKIAYRLFKELSNNKIETLKEMYQNEFNLSQFYDLDNINLYTKNDKTLKSYAIGQQNKLTFKDVVQAYTRIKTGKKIVYTYVANSVKLIDSLTLETDKLKVLQTAMTYPLKNGTANNVGYELRRKKIDYSNFLAKTGTAQFFGTDINRNKTSSFILVTDDYTIGIQLFGILPQNEKLGGSSARHLFINLISTLTNYEILKKRHK